MNLSPKTLIGSFLVLLPTFAISEKTDESLHDLTRPSTEETIKAAKKAEKPTPAPAPKKELPPAKRKEPVAPAPPKKEPAKPVPDKEKPKTSPQKKPSPPLANPKTIKLPDTYQGQPDYLVEPGDTLGKISALRYESPSYFSLIKVYNNVHEGKLQVGQLIRTPSVAQILREKGSAVLARYPEEIVSLLQIREDYILLERQLGPTIATGTPVTEEQKTTLTNLSKSISKITRGLLRKHDGVKGTPMATITQLRTAQSNFLAIRNGDFGKKNSRFGRIHLRLSRSMTNAIIWGQKGFK